MQSITFQLWIRSIYGVQGAASPWALFDSIYSPAMPNPLSSYFLCFLFTCHISFMLNPKIISLITDFKKNTRILFHYCAFAETWWCYRTSWWGMVCLTTIFPVFYPVFFLMYIHLPVRHGCVNMLSLSLSVTFLTTSVQYVPQVHTRDVCPEAIPDFSKAQAVCEAEAISYRFYNLSLRRRGR